MARVREAMEPSVVSLLRDQSLQEAASVLAEHDIGGAPVWLTKTDIIEHLAKDDVDHSVERAMTKGAFCVSADDPLDGAICSWRSRGSAA